MHKENFTERDIPYELLEKHGLSQAMIDDLPQSVMNKLLHGEYTPMLPLNFKTEAGDYQLMSRIALTRTANQDVRVILKPKIDTSSLGLYTQEQQELLKAGKTIIGMDPDDLRNGENNGKCFIQYDDESNQVLSVPTYAIGENIRTLTDVLGLDYDSPPIWRTPNDGMDAEQPREGSPNHWYRPQKRLGHPYCYRQPSRVS